jgi:hypothetical protein
LLPAFPPVLPPSAPAVPTLVPALPLPAVPALGLPAAPVSLPTGLLPEPQQTDVIASVQQANCRKGAALTLQLDIEPPESHGRREA